MTPEAWHVDIDTTAPALERFARALLLTGAALGDRFGRRRVFATGLVIFAVAFAAGGVAAASGAGTGP